MKGKIAVGPCDGMGPEITEEGVKALKAVARKFGHEFEITYVDIDGLAIVTRRFQCRIKKVF